MFEYNLADNLFEDEAMPGGFNGLIGFAEDPSLELTVGLAIDHVYLGEEGVEVGQVVDLFQVEDYLLLLRLGLVVEGFDGEISPITMVGGDGYGTVV